MSIAPELAYAVLAGFVGILAWVVRIVWKLETRYVRVDSCDQRRTETDRIVKAELQTLVSEVERRAVHAARNDMNAAIAAHAISGHPSTSHAISEIEKNVAVITRVQEDQGKVLEEIRSAVRRAEEG